MGNLISNFSACYEPIDRYAPVIVITDGLCTGKKVSDQSFFGKSAGVSFHIFCSMILSRIMRSVVFALNLDEVLAEFFICLHNFLINIDL